MRQTLADIEARHADIKKLEKSIVELHEMFVDVSEQIGFFSEDFRLSKPILTLFFFPLV